MYKQFIIILLLASSFVSSFAQNRSNGNKGGYTISGKLTSKENHEGIGFATIFIEDFSIFATSDIKGDFVLKNVPKGMHKVYFRALGYESKEINIEVLKNQKVDMELAFLSFDLDEINVTAKKREGSKFTIGQSAIEYIQPTSLADLMLLLPGNVYKEYNMGSFIPITSRQAGSDANTSLGVGVMTDGIPINNDGMRSQMTGVTANSTSFSGDSEIKTRSGMNQGTDMRYISTDHIESVEFTQGISSAKYGNLSSGTIQINSKKGVTPIRVRIKSDLKNKLAYIGKGFKLPGESAGTLNVGVDFLNSIKDVREEMDKFTRITGQAYYNNQFNVGESKLNFDARLSQTISVNKMKKDELIHEYNELYEANYSRTALMLKGNISLNKSWIEKLEALVSSDVTFDKITRHKMVILSTPLSVPLAKEEGEHEGMYLPSLYYSDFNIDNKPINLFVQLNATSRAKIANDFSVVLMYGLEHKLTKNVGNGAVIEDETRPPFPQDNTYMRPRPNHEIPALNNSAVYLQTNFLYSHGENLIKLSLGGRATKMFNLPDNYALRSKVLTEPRLNLSYIINKEVDGSVLRNVFRIGYGEEKKMPTLDYLYPDKIYKDFYMLNAYTNDSQHRHLITYTSIFDVVNPNVRENMNRKSEFGWDISYRGFEFSLTAFSEISETGFEYFSSKTPIKYDLYRTLKDGADISGRRPEKDDYVREDYSVFADRTKVMNSKKTVKKGVEYRFIFPKISSLATTIEVNGAYYKTNYSSSLPEYYYPDKMIADEVYPYLGIYNNDPRDEYKRFNTNVWFNTHIPRFKLMFTNFFQIIWLNSTQYQDLRQIYPDQYLDLEGNLNPVTQDIVDKIENQDPVFRYLRKTVTPLDYAANKEPISFMWNVKATKEFKNNVKLSFFVNNLIDFNPVYSTGSLRTDRNWITPYFGLELFLSF